MSGATQELMARARDGDDEALGALCVRYRHYLRKIVRHGLGPKLREQVDLSDAVQEALVEVVRQFPQFTGDGEVAFLGWMRQLARRKLADLGRFYSRGKRSPVGSRFGLESPLEEGEGRILDLLALSQSSPSEVASRRELAVLLARAMAGLPPPEADVLWLYHVEGLSLPAIGQRLGLTAKSVRGLWARGLKAVKRAVDRASARAPEGHHVNAS